MTNKLTYATTKARRNGAAVMEDIMRDALRFSTGQAGWMNAVLEAAKKGPDTFTVQLSQRRWFTHPGMSCLHDIHYRLLRHCHKGWWSIWRIRERVTHLYPQMYEIENGKIGYSEKDTPFVVWWAAHHIYNATRRAVAVQNGDMICVLRP